MSENWPNAELDEIRRLRVLAATVRFPVYYSEIVIPAPLETVWAVASDLEHELPRSLSSVRKAQVTRQDGEELELRAVGWLGQRARFDVVLRPGWCVMRSKFVLGAMAAVPDADGADTRFASLGGFRLPGARLARPGLMWLGRRSMRRFQEHPAFHRDERI